MISSNIHIPKRRRLRQAIYACLIVLCGHVNGQAQAREAIDSLLNAATNSTQHDSLKVKNYILLGRAFEGVDMDSAMVYYEAALALTALPSLAPYPEQEARVLENIGFAYIYGQNNYKRGLKYIKDALAVHQKNFNMAEAAKTQYNLGVFLANLEEYDSALFYYRQVLLSNAQLEDTIRLHESYNNIGLLYFYRSELDKAADYLIKAAITKEAMGETRELYHTYLNLGLIFAELEQYQKAIKYYQKAGQEAQQQPSSLALCLKNIGDSYRQQGDLEQAINYYTEANDLYTQENNQFGMADYLLNMALVSIDNRNYQHAENLLQETFKYEPSTGRKFKSSVLITLADVSIILADSVYIDQPSTQQKYIANAIKYIDKAWILTSDLGTKKKQLNASLLSSRLYQRIGDYNRALFFSNQANELINSISQKEQKKAIANAIYRYETDKIETENTLLKQERIVKETQVQRQRLLIIASISTALLIALITAIIYRSKQKLAVAKKAVDQALKDKDLLIKEVHHRIKNNLQIVSGLLELQAQELDDDSMVFVFSEGKNRVKAMGLIHQQLYQHTHVSTLNFNLFTSQLLQELSHSYDPDGAIKYHIEIPKSIELDIDVTIPLGLITNELISNSYKYAFQGSIEKPMLTVRFMEEKPAHYCLTVSDNGVGMDIASEKDKSFGLRLVYRLSRQLGGKINYIQSQENRFELTFEHHTAYSS